MSTVAHVLRQAAAELAGTSPTPRLDAELLMAHALGEDRAVMLLRSMSDPVPESFAALVERRMTHEPIAYILGHQPFYGRDFAVSPAVLIPRSDSESVVEAALALCGAQGRVLDCGTGSGALLLTLLAERPGWTGIGVDNSSEALEIAAENMRALGLGKRTDLLLRDWTEPGWSEGLGRFDCILANPPYVESEAELDREVREWEPSGALFAGDEGLDEYRRLVPHLRRLLVDGGAAVLEIGAAQAEAVGEIAQGTGFTTRLCRDLADRPRALVLT